MSTLTFPTLSEGIQYLRDRNENVISYYMVIAKADVVDFISSYKHGTRAFFLGTLALKKLSKKRGSHFAMVIHNQNADCTDVELHDLIAEYKLISSFTNYQQFEERGYTVELMSERSNYEPKFQQHFWLYWTGFDFYDLPHEYRVSLQNYHQSLIRILATEGRIDEFCKLANNFSPEWFSNKKDLAEVLALNLIKYGYAYLTRNKLNVKIRQILLHEYNLNPKYASKAAIVAHKIYQANKELDRKFAA